MVQNEMNDPMEEIEYMPQKPKIKTTATPPKTGQMLCYNHKGRVVTCAGTGQDGEFQRGLASPAPRFTDNNDGTVKDNFTGLIWVKNANIFGEVSWDRALENARNLSAGGGGLNDNSKPGDWRLPNINELQSLMNFSNSYGVAIQAENPFLNLQPANYWSSTSVAAFPALGWYTAMAVGPPVFDLKFNIMRMFPVRGKTTVIAQTGQKKCFDLMGNEIPGKNTGQDGEYQTGVAFPVPRFSDNGDGTITDELTGLVWLKNGNAFGTLTWEQALESCSSLSSGNYGLSDGSRKGDWRLPNINELRSLEDYGEARPALPAGHPFTNIRQSLCWSSTTVASAPNLARFLFVGIGACVWDHKKVTLGVWAVRDKK